MDSAQQLPPLPLDPSMGGLPSLPMEMGGMPPLPPGMDPSMQGGPPVEPMPQPGPIPVDGSFNPPMM
jgi:hypothetical protein